MATKFNLDNGGRIEVEVGSCSSGRGITINESLFAPDGSIDSVTVTCTCWDSDGKKYSTTKQCPKTGNTCDCSDPQNPKITCS